MKSFAPEFLVQGKWYRNATRFATREEAEERARDKFYSWSQAEDFRVTEADEEPNYKLVDGELVSLEDA